MSAVFSSVAPEFLGVGLHRHSPALAGLLVFLLFLMSVSGQVLVPHLWNALAAGCGLLVAGVALLVLSLAGSLASLFAAPRLCRNRVLRRRRRAREPARLPPAYLIFRSGGTSRYWRSKDAICSNAGAATMPP